MLLAGPGVRTCAQRRRHRLACLGWPGEAVHQAVKVDQCGRSIPDPHRCLTVPLSIVAPTVWAGVVCTGVDCTATWISATDRAGLGLDRGRGPRRSAVRVVGV